MAVMDEFKDEREAIKSASLKKKISYFVDYYKWTVFGIVMGLIVAVWIIHDIATKKDVELFVAMVNMTPLTRSEECIAEVSDYIGIDTDKQEVTLDTTMEISDAGTQAVSASIQKFVIYIASGDMDVVLADEAAYERYAYSEFYGDLREYYSKDQLAKLEGKLYYIDADTLSLKKELEKESKNIANGPDIDYPDPFKPELMSNPVPVGINVTDSKILDPANGMYKFSGETVFASIISTSGKNENAKLFMDYLIVQ